MGDPHILPINSLFQDDKSNAETIVGNAVLEKLKLQDDGNASEVINLLKEQGTDDEVVISPPPSPTQPQKLTKPSFSLVAQVSSKLSDLWTSARESLFGEDYWIPSDPREIALFPTDLLRAHKVMFPPDDPNSAIRVVQGPQKNRPGDPIHHVVCVFREGGPAYSFRRTKEFEDAEDLARRCMDCQHLFTLLVGTKEVKRLITEVITQLEVHPLYKMIHIAILVNREEVFSEQNIDYLNKNGMPMIKDFLTFDSYSPTFDSYSRRMTKTIAQPEGKYPLHLAVELGRSHMVRRMLELGSDPLVRDIKGNSIMHVAALTSVEMLQLLWEFEQCRPLLNQPNNEGYVPVMLAIRAANPRCLATMLGLGAEMSIRVQGRNPLFEAMLSKGKNTEIIKAIIEASPDLVTERDSSGNTALHIATYKAPLMGLLLLKHSAIDLNAKNDAGLTALHIYTHKGDIGLIVTICSYCCNIDAQDPDGNTSLHLAVSLRNLEATRLLLCLGADPNVTNYHGDTPRHLAARLRESELLKSLILCGGRRCEKRKTGCVSGCANEAIAGLLKSQSFAEMESPRISSVVKLAETFPDSVEVDHPVKDFVQKMLYNELFETLDEMANKGKNPRNMVNLLSLDGGGIRGLVIIQMLLAVEEVLGERMFPYFDWVAGTSTGALVATALAQGKSLRECQHIYLRFKDLIFDGWTRPYNSAVLELFMQEQIGQESLIEIKHPRLMISTVKADYFPVKLEFMRNYRLPVDDEINEELGFTDPSDVPAWKALRRTSAAPMFFSPVDGKYIDGGLIANNPCLDLLSEIELYNGTNSFLKNTKDNVEVGLVLSMGTGIIPQTKLEPLNVDVTNPITSAFAMKNLSLILIDQVTATEGAPVERSKSWCNAIRKPFFRLSAPLHKDISLAEKDDHDIAKMMWDCVEYTHQHRPYIVKLCNLLKKIGKSADREIHFNNGKTREMETQTSKPTTPV